MTEKAAEADITSDYRRRKSGSSDRLGAAMSCLRSPADRRVTFKFCRNENDREFHGYRPCDGTLVRNQRNRTAGVTLNKNSLLMNRIHA